jgi:hypothetical protein
MPAWFLRFVAKVLKEFISKDYAVVFMDDISIYSNNEIDYRIHIRAVMDMLQKQNFTLKDWKFKFGRMETEFVEYRVDHKGVCLLGQKSSQLWSGL